MNETINPLRQFFRQPAIYLKLPSGGEHWPPGSIDMPSNGELPVYPMTAIDEITYRTPDALFNGQAVVNVTQSCIPNIKNAWQMPDLDINTILTAIRIASYGHELEVSSTCPSCKEENEYGFDLRAVLDRLTVPDFKKTLGQGDLEIIFQPISYETQNQHSQKQFELQQTINSITRSELSEQEKLQRINVIMKDITQITIQVLACRIKGVKTPGALVTDTNHIMEFLQNCDKDMFNKIRDQVVAIRSKSELPAMPLKCTNCNNEYEQALNLDMSDFFASAS